MNKKAAKIGIVGWKTGENSFGATLAYLTHLSKYGDVQILTPTTGIMSDLDLVVLPGGKDMPSYLYGQVPHWTNNDSDQYKEYFIQNNLDQYIEAGIPIWGTCLGMQQLVVKFGGELCQNLPYSHGYSTEHRGELVHRLLVNPKFQLLEAEILARRKHSKSKVIEGNSLHHQGAYTRMVPDCFDIVCKTQDDVAEIIMHKELPIAGSQGHVEEDDNPISNRLIEKLIKRSPNYHKEEHATNNEKLSE